MPVEVDGNFQSYKPSAQSHTKGVIAEIRGFRIARLQEGQAGGLLPAVLGFCYDYLETVSASEKASENLDSWSGWAQLPHKLCIALS